MTEQSTMPTVTPHEAPRATAPKSRGRSRLLDIALLSRSRRRRLIRAIEKATGRTLLCYVSLGRSIDSSDPFDLFRLLEEVDSGASITLLLDSPGGDVDSADKMVRLLREACVSSSLGPTGDLEVVVPYQAKSAATLIALGADRILMSDSSELGPIDPQFQISDDVWVSSFAILRAYENAERQCIGHPDNPAFRKRLGKFSPVFIEQVWLAISRAQACAESQLMRQGGNYTAAPATLMDVDLFPSHGQMIDWRTAQEIGIPQVRPLDRQNPLWQQYWHLYSQLRIVCGSRQRVLESRDKSILAP